MKELSLRIIKWLLITIAITVVILYVAWPLSGYSDIMYENIDILRENCINKVEDGEVIPLKELAAFDWDKVLFIEPHKSDREINKEIGYRWGRSLPLPPSDTRKHVFFIDDGKVVCYFPGEVNAFLSYGKPNYTQETDVSLHSSNRELRLEDSPDVTVQRYSDDKISLYAK